MSFKKFILFLTFIISTSSFSQAWLDKPAIHALKKLEKKLEPYEDLQLSEEVKTAVFKIFREYQHKKWQEIKKMKDEGTYNEFTEWKMVEPHYFACHRKIKELLTPEQINVAYKGIK